MNPYKLPAITYKFGLAAGIALVGLQFASDSWFAEMITSLKPYYFIPFGIYISICLYYRKLRYAFLMFFLTIINAIPLLPLYFKSGEFQHRERIVVAQVNVENKNRKLKPLLKWLRQVNPDVIAIEELTPEWDLAIRKTFPEYSAYSAPREDYFGVGLYSKEQLSDKQTFVPIGIKPEEPALFGTIEKNKIEIKVAALHTLAPHRPEEMNRRNQQMAQIAEKLKSFTSPTIVLGDLNTVPWSAQMSRFKESSNLQDSWFGFGVHPTCCIRNLLWVPIDYCLTSKNIQATSISLGPDVGSDHRPVLIELAINDVR